MDRPAHRDEGRALGPPTLVEGAAPIAIIDFLANAEAVVQRLGTHTCVRDWLLVRRLGTEWVVLAGEGGHGFHPGDLLDRPDGATRHLDHLASIWEGDVVVDLTEGHIEPARGRPPADPDDHCDGLVAFPLWSGDGLFGAVCALPADDREQHELQAGEPMIRLTVELLTSVLGLDLDRSRLQRRLDAAESAALSDPMTGLGNRRAFERAVDREEARCARFGHGAGIMVLDLDGLKVVNDSLGHGEGDDLLRRAGETIRTTLRTADQAFRIGGDEFALLLPEVTADGLRRLFERLTEALGEAGVAASVGCRDPAAHREPPRLRPRGRRRDVRAQARAHRRAPHALIHDGAPARAGQDADVRAWMTEVLRSNVPLVIDPRVRHAHVRFAANRPLNASRCRRGTARWRGTVPSRCGTSWGDDERTATVGDEDRTVGGGGGHVGGHRRAVPLDRARGPGGGDRRRRRNARPRRWHVGLRPRSWRRHVRAGHAGRGR